MEPTSIVELSQSVSSNAINIDALWVLIAAALVFLMQAGFLCFEVGVCSTKE